MQIIYVKIIYLFNYLDIKADENTSDNLNEILKSEDSQASVKVNEVLVSEDLNDYIIKDLESLGMYYDIKELILQIIYVKLI